MSEKYFRLITLKPVSFSVGFGFEWFRENAGLLLDDWEFEILKFELKLFHYFVITITCENIEILI